MDLSRLARAAAAYDAGDPRRVHHFLKVYALCHLIGPLEGLTAAEQEVLDAAALLHDIGIHNAEHKFGCNNGKLQEAEGPAVARPMLTAVGATREQIDAACWLIAHHHTPGASEEKPFRILLEADFLVNAYEDGLKPDHCATARGRIFRTDTGRAYLDAFCLTPRPPL